MCRILPTSKQRQPQPQSRVMEAPGPEARHGVLVHASPPFQWRASTLSASAPGTETVRPIRQFGDDGVTFQLQKRSPRQFAL